MNSECTWIECDEPGPHDHAEQYWWRRPVEGDVDEVAVVLVDVEGRVTASEALFAQLMLDAGWERVVDPPTFADPGDTRAVPPCTGEPGCTSDVHMLCCPALLDDEETP